MLAKTGSDWITEVWLRIFGLRGLPKSQSHNDLLWLKMT